MHRSNESEGIVGCRGETAFENRCRSVQVKNMDLETPGMLGAPNGPGMSRLSASMLLGVQMIDPLLESPHGLTSGSQAD